MNKFHLDFIRENNRIEGIIREPTENEVAEFARWENLDYITVDDLVHFVKIYQPKAELRNRFGLDVRVGSHTPPRGSPEIKEMLDDILERAYDAQNPYLVHHEYETLHPFTDGNGRSGRMLWAWQMIQSGYDFSIGFLHCFYYQSLASKRPVQQNKP